MRKAVPLPGPSRVERRRRFRTTERRTPVHKWRTRLVDLRGVVQVQRRDTDCLRTWELAIVIAFGSLMPTTRLPLLGRAAHDQRLGIGLGNSLAHIQTLTPPVYQRRDDAEGCAIGSRVTPFPHKTVFLAALLTVQLCRHTDLLWDSSEQPVPPSPSHIL